MRVAVVGPENAAVPQVESLLLQLSNNRFAVVDRQNQSHIAQEKTLQISGDFSDTASVSLGQQWGAEMIWVVKDELRGYDREAGPGSAPRCVSDGGGAVFDEDDCSFSARKKDLFHQYFLDIRAIDVETGAVVGTSHVDMYEQSEGFTCLLDCTKEKAAQKAVRMLLGIAP
jgi:hypothetical protein